ncbi:MAG: hypothetical protein RQ824_11730, partial [bacterium]|nr:hypothetical protein [bacterium]
LLETLEETNWKHFRRFGGNDGGDYAGIAAEAFQSAISGLDTRKSIGLWSRPYGLIPCADFEKMSKFG